MKRGTIISGIILILCLLVLIYLANFSAKNGILPVSSSSDFTKDLNESSLININDNQLNNGELFSAHEGQIIKFNVDSNDYYIKVNDVFMDQKKVSFNFNGINFYLNSNENKKLNIDTDDYYDILLTVNSISYGSSEISLKYYNEKVGISD